MIVPAEERTVVIRPSIHTAFDPRTRQAVHELLAELSADGHNVTLEIPDPGQFSAQNSLDAIDIIITSGASTVVVLAVTDIYNGIKRWFKKRLAKDKAAGPIYITLRGPDGKPLKNFLGRAGELKDVTPPRHED